MSKLFKLKEWLTLEEASNHISSVLGETFTIADIYRQTLDGNLILSTDFVNETMARTGEYISSNEFGTRGDSNRLFTGNGLPDFFAVPSKKTGVEYDKLIRLHSSVFPIKGIWDLTMLGAEQFDIKSYYYKEISKVEVIPKVFDGMFLKQGDVLCQLQTSLDSNEAQACSEEGQTKENSYSPSNSLDNHDYIFVIKTKEITRFIQSLEDTPQEAKPLHTKERTTLLLLLGSILKKANIDINRKGVIGKIRGATELNNTPISETTISELLPLIRDAVELKQNK